MELTSLMVNAGSGLLGAVIGGAASLLGTRLAHRNALSLANFERFDVAVVSLRNGADLMAEAFHYGDPPPELWARARHDMALAQVRAYETSPAFASVLSDLASKTPSEQGRSRGDARQWFLAIRSLCNAWLSGPKAFDAAGFSAQSFLDLHATTPRPDHEPPA